MQRSHSRVFRFARLVAVVVGVLGIGLLVHGGTPAADAQIGPGPGVGANLTQIGTLRFGLGVTTAVGPDVDTLNLTGSFSGTVGVMVGSPGIGIIQGNLAATDSQGNQTTMPMLAQANALALSMVIDPTGLGDFTPGNTQLIFANGSLASPLLSGGANGANLKLVSTLGNFGGGSAVNGLGDVLHWIMTDIEVEAR